MADSEKFSKDKLKEVLGRSYSPFSKFKVAAALCSAKGHYYYACNVENSTIGATICAERSALAKMISEEGPQAKAKRVYILSETPEPITPCGICRQSLYEFCEGGLDVVSFAKNFSQEKKYTLDYLFPEGFRL